MPHIINNGHYPLICRYRTHFSQQRLRENPLMLFFCGGRGDTYFYFKKWKKPSCVVFLLNYISYHLTHLLRYLSQIQLCQNGLAGPSKPPHLGVLKSCSWLRQVHNKLQLWIILDSLFAFSVRGKSRPNWWTAKQEKPWPWPALRLLLNPSCLYCF